MGTSRQLTACMITLRVHVTAVIVKVQLRDGLKTNSFTAYLFIPTLSKHTVSTLAEHEENSQCISDVSQMSEKRLTQAKGNKMC